MSREKSRKVEQSRKRSKTVEVVETVKMSLKKGNGISGRKAEKRIHKRAKSVFWGRTQDPPVWE